MNTEQLDNAIARIMKKLEKGGYGDRQKKNFSKCFHNLKLFLILNKYENYDVEIGLKFLEAFKDKYSKKAELYFKHIRCIELLNDIYLYNDCKINKKILKKEIVDLSYYKNLLENYEVYLTKQNKKINFIKSNIRYAKKFLFYLEEINLIDINNLKSENFYNFFDEKLLGYDLNSRSTIGVYLRNFIDYLNSKKYFAPTRTDVFPVLKHYKKKEVLCFFSKEEIINILNSIDTSSLFGKRDYAILLIASTYGIRSCDICNFNISSIDWNKNLINFTQLKTEKFTSLPLTENVKFALLDYIKINYDNIRKQNSIFLSVVAPFEKLSSGTTRSILQKYILKANIDINGRRIGLHSLRHSVAKNMLDDNIPLTTIKEVLGHSSIVSTNQYIGVNFKDLKKISLEVPNYEK